MAIDPASNGTENPTDGSKEDAVPKTTSEAEAHRRRWIAQESSRLWASAPTATSAAQQEGIASPLENRLRSPQVALSRSIDAFNAFNQAEEEEVWAQEKAAQPYQSTAGKSRQDSFHRPDLATGSPHEPESTLADPAATETRQLRSRTEAGQPETGQYINPVDGSTVLIPAPPPTAWWERQPYYAIAHFLAIGGTLATAWLVGILAAQVFPGNVQQPPLQEAALRKSSRLIRRLWNVSQLWQTPTAETRIEAIPLPETGPILAPISLSPVERQPLIDELNAIETEVLTLDRRMQTLEKRLGKPPYKGADVESRINALRSAIDPPVRASQSKAAAYKPEPTDPNDRLLDVAKLKITLPSDALFGPGQNNLRDTPIKEQILQQVLDQLINYPQATVVVSSYSDDQAKPADAQKYTLAQANVLSDYLQQSLPDDYRWVPIGGGQAQPVASNADDMGQQRNRRIEIIVDTRSRR